MTRIEPKIRTAIERLTAYLETTGWRGYDPYDALNSPILRKLDFGSRWLRLAYTQTLKRLPLNIRPLLKIQKVYNPKGLGLFLSAWIKMKRHGLDHATDETIWTLITLLEQSRSRKYSGHAWGYPFDWQSEKELTPKYTPTIVNTAYVGHAHLDAWDLYRDKKLLDIARSACEFILKDLNVLRDDGGGICFSYTPLDRLKIYNASLLGAGMLARVSRYTGDAALGDIAGRAVRYVMERQLREGGWYYGASRSGEGIWTRGINGKDTVRDDQPSGHVDYMDGYHTGFVLESLWEYTRHTGDRTWIPAIRKGLQFYAGSFFLEDGTPKYYHNRLRPVDIHSIQALVTFSKMHELLDLSGQMEIIAGWFLRYLQDQDRGYFYYRKGRFLTNKIPYIRWSQAWALHALTTYYDFLHKSRGMDEN